ncbi:MAG TPA: Uma2 family endonuclease [Pyrinomonadaceae bacterium]|jgi:Uma2 family endonuclease
MSAIVKEKRKYSLEEYAELEKTSEERLEYFDGNVWSMAGASRKHERLVVNVINALSNSLRGRGCVVYSSNLRIKVPAYPPYRYPDVTALCGEEVFEDFYGLDVLINPSLIVEILSPSTKSFDIGDKFTYYKSIESFTEYLLIDQDKPHVVLYTKQSADAWLHREFNALQDKIFLSSLDCELAAAEIYENVEFPPVEAPRFPFEIDYR